MNNCIVIQHEKRSARAILRDLKGLTGPVGIDSVYLQSILAELLKRRKVMSKPKKACLK